MTTSSRLTTGLRRPTAVAMLAIMALLSSTALHGQSTAPSFAQAYRVVDSVNFDGPDGVPFNRFSGLAVTPSGRYVVTDIRDGTVLLFGRDGRRIAILGRRGAGPGEFQAPIAPSLDRQGRLHVPDIAQLRVTVLAFGRGDSTVRVVRTVSVGGAVTGISGLKVLDNGDYAIASGVGSSGRVLFIVDSLGSPRSSHFALRDFVPHPSVVPSLNRAVTQPAVASDGVRVFVTLSTSDSLWELNTRTMQERVSRIPSASFVPVRAPSPAPAIPADVRAWLNTQTVVTTVAATADALYVAVLKGLLVEATATDVSVRRASDQWSQITGVPPIVGVRGDTLISLQLTDEEVVVKRLVPRR